MHLMQVQNPKPRYVEITDQNSELIFQVNLEDNKKASTYQSEMGIASFRPLPRRMLPDGEVKVYGIH